MDRMRQLKPSILKETGAFQLKNYNFMDNLRTDLEDHLMHNPKYFLIANSKTSNLEKTIEKIKKLNIEENYNFVFFNRFMKDLNPFWLNFIRTNTKAQLLFVSRTTSEAKEPNLYPNNKKKALWGLYGEHCICSEKYKLDQYFKKIFIFANGKPEDCYYNCPESIFKKSTHINNFSIINNTNMPNPSTGLLMYLFIKKYQPNSMVYLIGFEHKGLKDHKFDFERIYFKSQRLPRLF